MIFADVSGKLDSIDQRHFYVCDHNVNFIFFNDLKSALGRYHNSQFKNITFASRNYLTLSNQIDLLNITATVMTPEAQLRSQVYNVLSSYIPVTLLIIVTCIIWSFFISRLTVYPINVMIEKINAISQGDYSKKINGLEKGIRFCDLLYGKISLLQRPFRSGSSEDF